MQEGIHHALVLTDDLEGTAAFWCDALGFRRVENAPLPFRSIWLARDGDACVHLADRGEYEATLAAMGLARVAGAVDHVAFRLADYDGLAARLASAGVEAVPNEVPGTLRQLFVTDPNGVRVELNVPV